MTVKEIAKIVGKQERAVHNWVSTLSAKNAEVSAKIAQAKATSKPANYDLNETCLIIETGLGKAAADVYRTNAVNAEVAKVVMLPSGAQLREMRLGLPQNEFMKRIDFMIGYSSKPRQQEKIEVAPQEQGLLQFAEIKAKLKASE